VSECNHNFGQGICFACDTFAEDVVRALHARIAELETALKTAHRALYTSSSPIDPVVLTIGKEVHQTIGDYSAALKEAKKAAKDAALVEREACARICDIIAQRRRRLARKLRSPDLVAIASECALAASTLAEAIRSRDATPALIARGEETAQSKTPRCPTCDNRGWFYTSGSSSYGRERCACRAPLSALGEAQVGEAPSFVDLGAEFYERMLRDDS
jgi:hypothetical protein